MHVQSHPQKPIRRIGFYQSWIESCLKSQSGSGSVSFKIGCSGDCRDQGFVLHGGVPSCGDARQHGRRVRGGSLIALMLSGTTSENLLKYATGNAGKAMRCHRRTPTRAGERVADDLLHVSKVRLMKSREEEEGWVYNLVSVDAAEDDRSSRCSSSCRGPGRDHRRQGGPWC